MNKGSEISHNLYRWLVQLEVLPNNQKYKPSGNFELEPRLAQQLQSGFSIGKLLSVIASEKGISINQPLIASIKNSSTHAARVYNWNILQQGFSKIGVPLSKEIQKQISSGNFEALVRFLIEINHQIVPRKAEKQKLGTEPHENLSIDLKKVRKYEEIENSESILEFVIILITKNMGLTSKQAVATLSESGKYLAHMFVKGIKGSFDEIQNFLEEIIKRITQIMYLVEKEPQKNLQFLLQILKPSLISRESEIAKMGSKALKALNYESLKYNSKNIVYQILCKQNQGFDFIYMGLKRHQQLNYEIFQFLYPLIQNSLFDFLEVHLRKTINNEQEYLRTMLILMEPLLNQKEAKEYLFKDTKLFATWVSQFDSLLNSKIKGRDNILINEETKILKTELMCVLWKHYYKEMEENQVEDLLIKITEQLKRNTRSEIYTVKIPSLYRIFDLLDFLAIHKNKLAALLYKKIIFLFVQNHHQNQTRQIILENLIAVLRKFPTIPLQFLLQPLLKQLNSKEGTSYILNLYDFEFIVELCKHPKMEQYYAISILEYFTRLYVKSVVYSSLSFRIIEVITARFCESEQIREYCLHSTEVNLNHYSMLVMGKNMGNKGMYSREKAQTKEDLIINNQKKSLIIELLKHYIQLEHRELTEQIKELVVVVFVEWYENKNYYDKGLASVLMIIGDIEEIVVSYKDRAFKRLEEGGDLEQNRESEHPSRSDSSKISSYQHPYKYNFDYESNERDTPILQENSMGYKKNKNNNAMHKYEEMISKKTVKPDPRVLEDLERIKEKWKLEQSRSRVEEKERAAKKEKIPKINEKQLLQRNLSLGYVKLPNYHNNDGKLLFDFDSVKTKYLKDSLDIIELEEEEEREKKSVDNIIHRYNRYIKNLFHKYANKSNTMSQSTGGMIISFTEIMRMLKEKGLIGKIPKIAINELITQINKSKKQKNVLVGIEEEDFPTFIIYMTDLLLRQDVENKKDEPFGLKVEKTILRMLEDEKNVRELFDPKILKIKEQIDYNEDVPIPDDYKKTREVQVTLKYYLNEDFHSIDPNIITCNEIVDEILYEALGIHSITPKTDFVEKTTLARVYKVPKAKIGKAISSDRHISRAETEQDSNTYSKNPSGANLINQVKKNSKVLHRRVNSKTHRNIPVEATEKQKEEKAEKERKRQLHAKKLKEQIERLRIQKQKHEQEKKQQEEKEQQRKKKKQEVRKQYLEENRKKLQQAREKEEQAAKEAEKKEKEVKEKKKNEVKAKEAELLEKEKKNLEEVHKMILEKKKKEQFKQKQKQKLLKNKNTQKLLNEVKNQVANDKMKELMIKNSFEKGELKEIVKKYDKQFNQLFQSYWIWNKEKIDLKGLAQLLKDFQVCNDYVTPKEVANVFKNVAKGQLLNKSGLEECIVKLSFRSSEIAEKCKQGEKEQKEEKEGSINVSYFRFMISLLRMEEENYKQVVAKAKTQSQN